jgi:hypothetical protein
MEKNEGALDRVIRFIVGIIALFLSLYYSFWWFVLAIPALITSWTGFCWPYRLLGINTLKKPIIKLNKTKSRRKKC